MASQVKSEDDDDRDPSTSPPAPGAAVVVDHTAAAEAALKSKLTRKRTKTGCLTCRKRRIKCGEERPVCRNCTKSKRHCDGYTPRVVFKQPTFDIHHGPNGGAHITFSATPLAGPAATHYIVPRGPAVDPAAYPTYPPLAMAGVHPPSFPPAPGFPGPITGPPIHPAAIYHAQGPAQMPDPAPPFIPSGYLPLHVSDREAQGLQSRMQAGVFTAHVRAPPVPPDAVSYLPPTTFPLPEPPPSSSTSPHHALAISQPAFPSWNPITPVPDSDWTQAAEMKHSAWSTYLTAVTPPLSITLPSSTHPPPGYHDQGIHVPHVMTPTHMVNAAAVETMDDEHYDVLDEAAELEDMAAVVDSREARQRILSLCLDVHQLDFGEMQQSRYDTFLYAGILDHYRVSHVANPLKNAATARVFAHFVSATGPSLSIFERHPLSTQVMFSEASIPFSQQGLWTYALPMAALRHQGLLHAMLALASLHIARLQGAPTAPSMRHYSWALKRVHHCVGDPDERLSLNTIAASMLLGFYEIMTADHMKWNMHLTGSKQLFVEVDFVGMTRTFRRLKAGRATQSPFVQPMHPPSLQDDFFNQVEDVDERMVSHLVGREIRYDGPGQVEAAQAPSLPGLDVQNFEMLQDLYWWYCKQDAYQSIVSGNPLLMDFSRWADCPPRAPLGNANAVYGSFDHLVLLLGRIADFSARDRERKLKQMAVNGGQWRPAPGMNMPRPPQPPQPPTPVSATHTSQPGADFPPGPPPPSHMPQFYGMAPPPHNNVQMPSSYSRTPSVPTPTSATSPDASDDDLQAATHTALDEYARLRAALQTFKESLGPAFDPLTSEYHAQIDTPFGPALTYRSYDISCLWAVYHMAVIIAARSHPHMPPAMHVAAAVAAPDTAHLANEIGRIAAGIMLPSSPDQPLNPSLGSALCESCMPVFFAAVQYHDPRQRHATVLRIFRIARRTGWGSAELIAHGCETAWIKAAAAGRGPPYVRLAHPPSSSSSSSAAAAAASGSSSSSSSQPNDDPRLPRGWAGGDPNAPPGVPDGYDRRRATQKPGARLLWAVGVLGAGEDDVARVEVKDEAAGASG